MSGTPASIAHIVVIMIGRKRSRQAVRIASRVLKPCVRSASRAKSIIMIAFFLTMPMSRITPMNAIMMIDFALEAERTRGMPTREAILEACQLRFRPIMMTTMAAMLGALPLALGAGDGAEMRRPLGIAIVGGLMLSQLLTLYTTPVVYLYLDRLALWAKRKRTARSVSGNRFVETPLEAS